MSVLTVDRQCFLGWLRFPGGLFPKQLYQEGTAHGCDK